MNAATIKTNDISIITTVITAAGGTVVDGSDLPGLLVDLPFTMTARNDIVGWLLPMGMDSIYMTRAGERVYIPAEFISA